MDIKLGDRARDIVTKMEGIVVGKTQWLTGCDTVGIAPGMDKEGKVMDTNWFDITRVEVIEPEAVRIGKEKPPAGIGVG